MKEGQQHSQETRYLMGALRLGIDPMEYGNMRRAGFRWCFRCQRWQLAEEFGRHPRTSDGIDTQCIEARNDYAREYQRRKRAAAKQGAA